MSYVIDGDFGEPFDMGPPDGEPEPPDTEEETDENTSPSSN